MNKVGGFLSSKKCFGLSNWNNAINGNHHDIFERIKTSIVGCLNLEKKITTFFGVFGTCKVCYCQNRMLLVLNIEIWLFLTI